MKNNKGGSTVCEACKDKEVCYLTTTPPICSGFSPRVKVENAEKKDCYKCTKQHECTQELACAYYNLPDEVQEDIKDLNETIQRLEEDREVLRKEIKRLKDTFEPDKFEVNEYDSKYSVDGMFQNSGGGHSHERMASFKKKLSGAKERADNLCLELNEEYRKSLRQEGKL